MLHFQESQCNASFKDCILREKAKLIAPYSQQTKKKALAYVNVLQYIYQKKSCLLSDIFEIAAQFLAKENDHTFRNRFKTRHILDKSNGFPCFIFEIPHTKHGYQAQSISIIVLKPIGNNEQNILTSLITIFQSISYTNFYENNTRNKNMLNKLSYQTRLAEEMKDNNTANVLKNLIVEFFSTSYLSNYVRLRAPNSSLRQVTINEYMSQLVDETEVCYLCKSKLYISVPIFNFHTQFFCILLNVILTFACIHFNFTLSNYVA